MSTLEAVIIAIVEGITEFLPISSTAHMAITSAFMGIGDDAFTKLFEIVIQLGAILSVVVIYWKRFFNFKNLAFYFKLFVAVIPALVFGALFKKHIEEILGNPTVLAVIMLLGGILLLFVDKWFNSPHVLEEKEITYKKSLVIGLYQTLAIVFPGLSRSAATIIGGMQQKLSRNLAAEFSFFLAVPTMLAATVKSLYDVYKESPEVMGGGNLNTLLLGSLVAFVVALLSIKFLVSYLQKNGFKVFGYYRIIAGIILLVLIYKGYI
ncbi:MAG: undecaprenyl-diphosphate phosphatase [Chitinophagaceae bacterium]|nr:undecaprenyl-diphosphate phosphatase [Chitinophagaceae bacterium]